MAAVNIDRNKFNEMIAGDRPVLVDFWAPWCVYCRRIGPAYDRVADEYGDEIEIVKINIDDEPELSDAEGIEVIPTLKMYRSGNAVGSVVNPESKAAIEDFIRVNIDK